MREQALIIEKEYDYKLIQSPGNAISMAMQLKLPNCHNVTELGSILYSKRVMGHRIVVASDTTTKIGSLSFRNYGSHTDKYGCLPYITFASAVGTKPE